jgi:hypothetical protein
MSALITTLITFTVTVKVTVKVTVTVKVRAPRGGDTGGCGEPSGSHHVSDELGKPDHLDGLHLHPLVLVALHEFLHRLVLVYEAGGGVLPHLAARGKGAGGTSWPYRVLKGAKLDVVSLWPTPVLLNTST